MSRPSTEERERLAAEAAWRKATDEHAVASVRAAIDRARCRTPAQMTPQEPTIRNAQDQGGHVVEVCGPDGVWRRYFLRLTEVRA